MYVYKQRMTTFNEVYIYKNVLASVPELPRIPHGTPLVRRVAETCQEGRMQILQAIFDIHMEEIDLVKQFEGLGLDPYNDHTIQLLRALRYTLHQALQEEDMK